MNVRGPVLDVGEPREVSTGGGSSELVEVVLRPERGAAAPTTVTLWGKWTHTAAHAEPGMELLVTDAETDEYRGETTYATTRDSYVVLEPGFLVDVTDVRAWVDCPRIYYLNKLTGVPLKYPVVKGTIVHEVFGDLLRGVDLETAVEERVAEAGLELGLLGRDAAAVRDEVRRNAAAVEGWLSQGRLDGADGWRSEQTLVSPTFGMKGRADAVRRSAPVELKTGKNTDRSPRFQDKVQAACYALLLEERGADVDTATLIYTKNATLDRGEAAGDLAPAKEFTVGGLRGFVVRARNEIAAAEHDVTVPTGHEADARCEYCFERDACMAVAGRLDQESKAGRVGSPVPAPERDYLDRFYRGVEAERRAVHAEYRRLWENSAAERAAADRALVGLVPAGRRELDDGRWELRARRTDDAVSKLREGDVALASEGDPVGGRAETVRIARLDDEVVVTADEPLALRRLDVSPSEIGVDRQLLALHDAVLAGDESVRDVVMGRRAPAFDEPTDGTFVDNNPAQDRAVERAVTARDCALIHGPPGTGKTHTIARTVRALVDRGERVLLAAFTNRAVDNALAALREQGFEDALRVGTETGVRPDMRDLRLDPRGDPDERAATLRGAPVVAATTATCGSRTLRESTFDVAVVDEASQLTEPGTLAAVARADRFVLVGDHRQLPPVVRSEAGEPWTPPTDDRDPRERPPAALQVSLFERLVERYPEAATLLDRQYRMAQRIQAFPSAEFYDGALRPATGAVATRSLADLDGVDPDALPPALRGAVSFVDPGGERTGNTNPVEADRVAAVVGAYLDAGVAPSDVGVIAPFRAQVAEIDRRVPAGVTVDTVDRFQGSSEEVIVVSFVATGALDGPIFEDTRRVNVALTRARRALALVGDAEALGSEPFYARMRDWARR